LEARLSPDERERIRRAAELEGRSMSSFVVAAAVARADRVIEGHAATIVPRDYFDEMLAGLDDVGRAPGLRRAAMRARERTRIR